MISHADLVHDLADVLHDTRMHHLVDGVLPIETPSALPTRRDREQAQEVVDRLIELGLLHYQPGVRTHGSRTSAEPRRSADGGAPSSRILGFRRSPSG